MVYGFCNGARWLSDYHACLAPPGTGGSNYILFTEYSLCTIPLNDNPICNLPPLFILYEKSSNLEPFRVLQLSL